MRGIGNEYANELHDAPKNVFKALAFSFALRLCEDDFAAARQLCHDEWIALHAAGIVPQKPRALAVRHVA